MIVKDFHIVRANQSPEYIIQTKKRYRTSVVLIVIQSLIIVSEPVITGTVAIVCVFSETDRKSVVSRMCGLGFGLGSQPKV